MPNVKLEGAKIVAERIQNEIRELNIKHEFDSGRGRITVSIGVATLTPSLNMSPQVLINQADQKMYAAKKNGRNQFVSIAN